MLFKFYVKLQGEVIWRISCYLYVDDTLVCLMFPADPRKAIQTLNKGPEAVWGWMRARAIKPKMGR